MHKARNQTKRDPFHHPPITRSITHPSPMNLYSNLKSPAIEPIANNQLAIPLTNENPLITVQPTNQPGNLLASQSTDQPTGT